MRYNRGITVAQQENIFREHFKRLNEKNRQEFSIKVQQGRIEKQIFEY